MSADRRRLDAAMTYITTYHREHGYPPSVRELADHLGVATHTAHTALRKLVEDGLITVTPGIPRSIVVTGAVMKEPEVTLDG